MRSKGRRWVWMALVLAAGALAAGAAAEQDIENEIAENFARIEHAQTRQAQIDTEIAGLSSKREDARGRLHERARALYRVRRAGMLPVAGGFEALMSHLARVQRLSRMVKNDLDTMEFLENRGSALRDERGELQESLEQAKLDIKALETRKEELAENRRSANLFEGTFRGEPREPTRTDAMSYGRIRVSGDMDDLGEGFAKMRGELALPVQGSMRIGDSTREGAPGLEFYGRSGGAVRAAADGRVAFARRHGEYGMMVILDHGGSFYTVYGGLGSADVQVGDWVGMSTRLGALETGKPDAIVFFEIRRGTRPLDARSWLGL